MAGYRAQTDLNLVRQNLGAHEGIKPRHANQNDGNVRHDEVPEAILRKSDTRRFRFYQWEPNRNQQIGNHEAQHKRNQPNNQAPNIQRWHNFLPLEDTFPQ